MNKRYKELSVSRDAKLNNEKGLSFCSSFIQKRRRNKLNFPIGTLLIVLLFLSMNTNAQVSSLLNATGFGYTFSTTSGSYTTLSGGTVFQSGATLSTDGVSGAIALPSAFTFNGIKENTIYISNNGFITFEKPQTTLTTRFPISTTTTSGYDGVISGLGNDLVASVFGTPEIRYGNNGSGDFVIQFQDLAINLYAATRVTFQIVLKSDRKTVQIVYGPNNTGQVSASGSQVGIRGTSPLDWNNRFLVSGGNWNTTGGGSGSVSSSTMPWTDTTVLPTSGRIFQWVPTSYVPTYLTTPFTTTQDFTSWTNGSGPLNVPSTNWATNGYGNASWQIDTTTATTTTSGWSSTNGAYTPADYANAVGGRSARFHNYNSTAPQVGYLDYYVDLSSGSGMITLDFWQINLTGADILQVYLSTNGGASFTQVGADYGVAPIWTARSIPLGNINSATTIIRFKATADALNDDIGLDNVKVSLPLPCSTPTLVSSDRKSTRLNSSHSDLSRMPSSA